MFLAVLFSFIVSSVLAIQVPLGFWQQYESSLVDDNRELSEWSLGKLPDPNGTDHLVFETVHSLLQHWPNTRMRNGHNIVPGIIPQGTLLYHGTNRPELPTGPEWTAIDPEHAYFFCRDPILANLDVPLGCWQATLVATRPLKVVYFDGSSAAKLPNGPLDTQDLLVWGDSPPELWDDIKRAEGLCRWGRNHGIDGFVRMEMTFETILCDFTSGVSVVSFSNLIQPIDTEIESPQVLAMFESLHAGTWHNRFPGETRIQLDLSGLISFYDTQLAPSLVAVRANQERWDHRVGDISSEDFSHAKSRLEATLTRPTGPSSGIDWKTIMHVIVDRFSGRLELVHYLLGSSATNQDEILDLASKTQIQLRIMLTPYIPFSAAPTHPSDETELNWTVPVYKLCATTHTRSLDFESDSMSDSENLILQAARGTTREICRVVTKMWAAGVYAGVDASLNTKSAPDITQVTRIWGTWREDLDRLMGWLDWSVWVKCDPDCGPLEMCYLPTWPINFPCFFKPEEQLSGLDLTTMGNRMFCIVKPAPGGERLRPQPQCIRRFEPFDFLTPK